MRTRPGVGHLHPRRAAVSQTSQSSAIAFGSQMISLALTACSLYQGTRSGGHSHPLPKQRFEDSRRKGGILLASGKGAGRSRRRASWVPNTHSLDHARTLITVSPGDAHVPRQPRLWLPSSLLQS